MLPKDIAMLYGLIEKFVIETENQRDVFISDNLTLCMTNAAAAVYDAAVESAMKSEEETAQAIKNG